MIVGQGGRAEVPRVIPVCKESLYHVAGRPKPPGSYITAFCSDCIVQEHGHTALQD